MSVIPKLEPLEDRIVLDGADPDVTITGPDGGIELGQQDVGFTLTFDNAGTETGYAPYAELIIPTSGADGENDGPTFDSASFLGADIETTELEFDAAGEVEHPFLTNPDGSPFIVTGGLPGDTLVVFELPYGSFSPGNPSVDIDVVLDFSDQADLNAMPEFQVLGGFALGCDPLDNPVDDAPVRGVLDTSQVDPQLLAVSKTNTAPEFEAATGPSYVYQYILTVDVAPGQTIEDFVLTDNLPPEIVYVGNLSISGGSGATVTTEPTQNAQVPVGGQLIIDFEEVSDTVTVTFDYYVSNSPSGAGGAPTNDPNTGLPANVANDVTGTGNWVPLDADDAPQIVSDSGSNTIAASSLAVQKYLELVEDNNAPGASPGDVYEFTLDVQVSDYFTFGDVLLQDTLGDGWVYQTGSATFFTVEEDGNLGSASGKLSLAPHETVNDDTPGAGQTEVIWDISAAMLAQNDGVTIFSDGLLIGDIARDGTTSGTQTTVTITYRAEIRSEFENTVAGEVEIGQGDVLSNSVEASADLRGNPDDGADPNTPSGTEVSNTSAAEVAIARGQIEAKTVFALNGDTTPPDDVVIAAGDEVTFAVTYRAPLAAFENFRIEDNLPQLVFDAAGEFNPGTTWVASPSDRSVAPAGGTAYFGANTSPELLGLVPTITTDGPNNGLIFDFGDFTLPTPAEATIEILFTATVEDAIFAPDLFLTNQATAFETNTFGDEISSTAIAQFDYGEPSLNISKGVVATDSTDPETQITGTVGLTGVTSGDTGIPRFSGIVSSGALNNAPIDVNADIENVDSGDLVTFAIVAENEGTAPNGAFNVTVTDTLPDGFIIPPAGAGLNLSITDGAGTPLSFTRPDGTPAAAADLFTTGLLLTDDAPLQGALSTFSEASGENVVVITYDLQVEDLISPSTTLTNTAAITSYNAFEGNGLPFDAAGPENRVVDPIEDTATATTEDIEITKTIDARQFDGDITGRGNSEVVVGENFEFIIRVDVPEGQLLNTVISDTVRLGGLTLVSAEIETFGAQMTSSTGLGLGTAADTTVSLDGETWSFDFGTLTNNGDNDATNDFIEIRVFARAEDDDVGGANHRMRNVAQIEFENSDGTRFTDRNGANTRIIEPQLDLTKTATPSVVEANDTVSYEVEIDNPTGFRDAPAFDLTLSDALDPVLTLDTGSITVLLNGVVQTFDGTNFALTTNVGGKPNAFDIFIDRLDQNDTILVRYEGTVDPGVASGLTIPNTAGLVFDSTPEDDSGADGDDREFSLSDDAEVVTASPELDKAFDPASTSYGETTGAELGIGELASYDFTITIPEGATDDVVLTDTLPAGLEYVSSTVVRIGQGANDNISGSILAVGASGTNVGQVTTFTFDDLTNVQDGINDASDEIVVRITARVTDAGVSGTDPVLTNVGTLSFTDGDGMTSTVTDSEDVTIVEPDVSLAKSVTPTSADAGDIVTYSLRAANDGSGPAYDMVITDDGVGPEVVALGTATLIIQDENGATVTPTEAPSFVFDGSGVLTVTVPDLAAGHSILITYDATVQNTAVFASDYTNSATIARYDSNPEGTATTPPADPDAEERTYTGPTATADVSTPAPTLEKRFLFSYNSDTAGTNLSVGEEVTYELTITAPQGTADVILTDALPTGLLAQSARVISIGDDLNDTSTTLTAGDQTPDTDITISAARDEVTFDFGTLVIDGSNDAAGTDTEIVVRITAIVADVAAATDGATLTNTATLSTTNADGATITATDTATVSVVEPDLDVEKTGPIAADPGDVVPYSITVTNTGTGPAYDTVVTDTFAESNLIYQAGSAQVFMNGALLVPQPGVAEPAPTATDGFQVSGLTLQTGDVVRVDFMVQLDALAPEAQTFTNTASVAFDSVEGSPVDADGAPLGRDETASDDHDLATVPFITKTPFASQFSETESTQGAEPFELAIGEEVTYRYEITLPEIALDSVIATDTLPTGLEFVSASVVNVNGTGANGTVIATPDGVNPNEISLDFGAMVNAADGSIGSDDVLVFEVVARVTDAANAGDTLTNSVDLNVDPSGSGPFATQTTTADVTIVEPDVSIDKTGPLALSPGGAPGTFTITITNDGVSGFEGPAYDLDVTDTLPAGMTLDTGSFSFATGSGAGITPENFTASSNSFLAEFPLLDVGDSIVITYRATLDAGSSALATFENTASVDFFSAPDDLVDGGGAPVARDYTPVDDTHRVATLPTLDKDATSTGVSETPENADADSALDATIGETVTYTLTLTLPEIPMDSVVLTDTLPDGLSFVSAEVTAIGSEITVGGSTDINTINTNAAVSTVGQATSITLANVVNQFTDGTILAAQDAITVEITARVTDAATNVGALPNTQLTNTAGLVVTPQGEPALSNVTATETIEIVEPALSVQKTGNPAVNPGDTVSYSVAITNDGTSPAFDVQVADTLADSNLSLQAGTVQLDLDGTDITARVTITETASGFSFELDDMTTADPIPIGVGETLTVTYYATLSADAPEAQTFLNTIDVNFDSLPGDPVDANGTPIVDRDYSASDQNSVATVPFLTKTPISSNFTQTDSTLGSDPFELSIGEEVTYEYQLFLPEIAMDSVIFEDNLDPGLEFVSATVTSIGTGITAPDLSALSPTLIEIDAQSFAIDFGAVTNSEDTAPPTIGTDDIITIQVVARVTNDGVASGGDTLNNTAFADVIPTAGDPLAQTSATASVSVVEPQLNLVKAGPDIAEAGDVVTYSITITNAGVTGGAGPAFDLEVADVLPNGLALDPATLSYTIDGAPIAPATETSDPTGFEATFETLAADGVLVITYDATVTASLEPVTSFQNTATVNYDSAPGDPVDGDGNPAEQTYAPVSDSHVLASEPTLDKSTLSSQFAETPDDADGDGIADLAIGEEMTYRLVLTLPDLALDTVTLTDQLPVGMAFVSANVPSVGSEITLNGATTIASSGQTVTVTLNDVVNAFGDGIASESEDAIIVEITARLTDVPSVSSDAVLTNTAGLVITPAGGAPLDPVTDTAMIEVIEPDVSIAKSVSDPEPTIGDTITYSFVIGNAADATGPAFNTVLTDQLPAGLTLTGGVTLSDPTLANFSPSAINGASALVVSIPVLQPGQSVTITADVFVGFTTQVVSEVTNTGTLSSGTTPIAGDPNGRATNIADSAGIVVQPVTDTVEDKRSRAIGGIDDEQFLPVLLIDPIFTGTAEPGSNVTINLYRQDGSLDYVRNAVADTGGHWIALFPRVVLTSVVDTFHEEYAGSALFDAPVQTLDAEQADLFFRPVAERELSIGSDLLDEAYTLSVNVDRPSTLPQEAGLHNTRTFFAPAHIGEVYGTSNTVTVDQIFQDIAFRTVEDLYTATADPLGISLNQFNYEFLTAQTAVPGSQ